MPESERAQSLSTQFERLLEDLPQLSVRRQEAFFRRVIEASEAWLRRLDEQDRPGAVIPRSAHRQAPGPTPDDARRLRYNPATGALEPVS